MSSSSGWTRPLRHSGSPERGTFEDLRRYLLAACLLLPACSLVYRDSPERIASWCVAHRDQVERRRWMDINPVPRKESYLIEAEEAPHSIKGLYKQATGFGDFTLDQRLDRYSRQHC